MKEKNELQIIEENYVVNKLKVGNLYIWPILRQRVYFEIFKKKFNFNSKLRTRSKTQLLKNLFYGLSYVFKLKKYDFIFFNNADKRTFSVNKKKYDVFFDAWADKLGQEKSLFIEWAIRKHYSRAQTYSENVISDIFFKYCGHLCSFFIKSNIDFDEIEKIKKEYNFDFDVKHELKTKLGELYFYKFLFRWVKPKAIFLISSFTKNTIVIAAHLEKIKVYEAQHGYIGDNHQFYNSQYNFDQRYYPDYLISFGNQEKNSIPKGFIFKEHQILPVGSLYLESIKSNYTNKKLEALVKLYDTIFCVTLQTVKEDELLKWVHLQAKQNNNWLFILMPKNSKYCYQKYTNIKNCMLMPGFNIYQILKYADFNITIYSTTAIEAPYFNVKTLFYNVGNLSKKYYDISNIYSSLINPEENINAHHLSLKKSNLTSYFITDYLNNVKNTKLYF